MRRMFGVAGLAVLGAGLLGWGATGFAQLPPAGTPSNPYVVPPTAGGQPNGVTAPVVSPDPAGTSVGGFALPEVGTTPMPQPSAAPAVTPIASTPMPSPMPQSTVQPQTGTMIGGQELVPEHLPGQTEGNPTGRQEPAVSLEWIGPAAAKVGQPADYTVVIRNACNIPVQQVMVRVRVPKEVAVTATEPKAVQEENVLMWELGTLLPKQEKGLQVRMVPPAKGDVPCQAWVTFTGASAMRMRVREPKLLLKATAPEKVMVGDAATFVLTVSNPGDHPAEQVRIHAEISEGLEHARGNKIAYDIGNLGAGETRSVQVICLTKAGGTQHCDAVAEAEGGMKAADKAECSVIMPRVDLEVSAPKLRYLDRRASYVFKVTNPGDAPATNVVVSDVIPAGFKFMSADAGGRHDFSTRTVSWFLGEVGPGQSREVKMEVLAVNPGEHVHKVAVNASRGLKVEQDVMTRVEGLSAILIEVVDLEDPVEVGADTAYEIRVTNTGSKTETDVRLVCTFPADKMTFKGASGPSRYGVEGNSIVFEPLPKLAPRADAIYRVNVRTTGAGTIKFRSVITSTNLTDPVIVEEATRIYED